MVGFSLILGILKNTLSRILSNPYILVGILFITILIASVMYVDSKQQEILRLNAEIVDVQKSNDTLRNNVVVLADASKHKDSVIKQLEDDRKLYINAIKKMTETINKTNRAVSEIHSKIDDIKQEPSADIGPYLKGALKGVKELREGF
jgi:hypothetical protein